MSAITLSATSINLEKAATLLRDGGVVAFPTDTVYGLGAHFLNARAIRRIYLIKGRSEKKPLQLILSDVSEVETVADEVPDIFWQLAARFLPGGLTLVLKKSDRVPLTVTAGVATVAIRVPDNNVALDLVKRAGIPLAATSANRSGRPSMTTARDVLNELGRCLDAVVDGGPAKLGRDSTVLDLTQSPPRILREGAISFDLIYQVCPEVEK
ncbi:MAG: threonylcarbamoyl-AMP synthase [Dehalococcoidia bacterium]|nr:threonylcarbamoyl-AMP synthase [Dehalococcoidia bacterium]